MGISVILLASLVTALDSEGQEAQAYFRGTVAAFTAASFSAVAAVLAERALDGRDPSLAGSRTLGISTVWHHI